MNLGSFVWDRFLWIGAFCLICRLFWSPLRLYHSLVSKKNPCRIHMLLKATSWPSNNCKYLLSLGNTLVCELTLHWKLAILLKWRLVTYLDASTAIAAITLLQVRVLNWKTILRMELSGSVPHGAPMETLSSACKCLRNTASDEFGWKQCHTAIESSKFCHWRGGGEEKKKKEKKQKRAACRFGLTCAECRLDLTVILPVGVQVLLATKHCEETFQEGSGTGISSLNGHFGE